MTLPKENLDNKAFDDLLKEAVTRIPVYAPEWTDHNIHDPGITFIELFAWLTEMQIYRLNRINDKSYRKFLKLMGIPKPEPARAAKVDVTFSLRPGFTQADVPAGTKIAATDQVTGEDILFETEQALKVVSTELKLKILSHKDKDPDNVYTDNTDANKNDNVYYYAFRSDKPEQGDELYLGFNDNPGSDITLAFYLLDDDSLKKEDNPDLVPSGTLIWEYHAGGKWNPVEGIKDETRHLIISGKLRINIANEMDKTYVNDAKDLFWLRCRVEEAGYEIPPRIDCILLNTITAVHAVQHNDPKDCTFAGNGLPDFYIDLKNAPVLDKTLTVNVNEPWREVKDFASSKPDDRHYTADLASGRVTFGNGINGKIPSEGNNNIVVSYRTGQDDLRGYKSSSSGLPGIVLTLPDSPVQDKTLTVNIIEPWSEVEDFDASKPGDRHYTVDLASGRVAFGDGINGKIPPKGKDNITVSYRSGGGARGNVKPNDITRVLSGPVDRVTVNNAKAASGGGEAETLEEAVQRARKELKAVSRAVTSADYEDLALNTPGLRVARAKALPRYHPSQDREVPGIISVIVVPESPYDNPKPGKGFLKTVYRHLENHRLLTTELFVLPPEYVEVSVNASVAVKPKSLPGKVKKDVENKLKNFLHPVSGGIDGKGWPFGRSVYISEIYEIIDGVEGVDYVKSVSLSGKGKTATGDIDIPAEGLVFLTITPEDIVAEE